MESVVGRILHVSKGRFDSEMLSLYFFLRVPEGKPAMVLDHPGNRRFSIEDFTHIVPTFFETVLAVSTILGWNTAHFLLAGLRWRE